MRQIYHLFFRCAKALIFAKSTEPEGARGEGDRGREVTVRFLHGQRLKANCWVGSLARVVSHNSAILLIFNFVLFLSFGYEERN